MLCRFSVDRENTQCMTDNHNAKSCKLYMIVIKLVISDSHNVYIVNKNVYKLSIRKYWRAKQNLQTYHQRCVTKNSNLACDSWGTTLARNLIMSVSLLNHFTTYLLICAQVCSWSALTDCLPVDLSKKTTSTVAHPSFWLL